MHALRLMPTTRLHTAEARAFLKGSGMFLEQINQALHEARHSVSLPTKDSLGVRNREA